MSDATAQAFRAILGGVPRSSVLPRSRAGLVRQADRRTSRVLRRPQAWAGPAVDPPTRAAPRRNRRRRRGRGLLLFALLVALALTTFDLNRRGLDDAPLPFDGRPPDETAPADPEAVLTGTGNILFAPVDRPVAGAGGPVLRYRVGVEEGLGVPPEQFAEAVESILSDGRSWTAGGTVRFQRVSGAAGQDFTVYLASPVLSEAMCAEDGLETHQYTSCRLADGRVVINSARWLTGVPEYDAPLAEYRAYVVNHEVGHQLGYGHELCPAPGQPAPVMQQQTLGLAGCLPYGWPYRDGAHYAGPPAASDADR